MLASRPLVAASVILPSILLLGYLWQKHREEESAASSEGDSSPETTSTVPVDSREVSAKLESLNRFRLDCIEEERCEESIDIKSVEVISSEKLSENLEVRVELPKSDVVPQQTEKVLEDFINHSFAESVAIISEVREKPTVQFTEVSEVITMTTEESVEVSSSSEQVPIPDVLSALKDPIVSPDSNSPPPISDDGKVNDDGATADTIDDNLSSPVKSEISQKSESISWSDLIEADEELELEECRENSPKKIAAAIPGSEEHGRNDSGVASPTEDFSRPETVAATEDKARNSSGEDAGIGGSETDDVSDGNADLTNDDSQMFSYHFYIQDYLTGQFIGTKGTAINNLKTTCGCNVIVRDETSLNNQRRNKLKTRDRRYGEGKHGDGRLGDGKYMDGTMNLVMLEGTRSSIDKCLDTIKERFLRYPELTLEQINKPENTSLSLNAGSVALSLVEGIMHDVVISSIVYGDHIFIQQPTNPTFPALQRLDACMNNTYSELTCPSLTRPVIANSICVAPSNGGWYRCQVVSYDEVDDTCNVKFVDYGGYDVIPAEQLKQIRTDFLSLPFQAIECHLANILVPDGDTIASTILEELVNGQAIQARMLGVDQDNLPMVHVYRNYNGQTVMVNRELVDRNCAEWIESKFVALPEMAAHKN